MWELMYEDTFGFGDDRDPLKVERSGEDDGEGFYIMWTSVLSESITGTPGKPSPGFARFTLVITKPGNSPVYITIDTDRYLFPLSALKHNMKDSEIRELARCHYESCVSGSEDQFWSSLDSMG